MLNKIASFALIFALTAISFQTAFAKSSNDWGKVTNLKNREIAVQTIGGQTVFGILNSVTDNEIGLQVAEKSFLSSQLKSFQRSEIKKVWSAELHVGERNTGKGAAIGAGIGAAAGVATVVSIVKSGNGDGLESLAIPFYAIIGGGIGAVAGFFAKKGHKKKALVYEM
jgi:hypothetical protein